MPRRISVVVSQAQSQHPAKRGLEEDIVTALIMEPGIDVTVVPHLYDLSADSTGMLALSQMGGDVVVLSWLYPRAARWTLDRNGIRGQEGISLLKTEDDEDEDEEEASAEADDKDRVIDSRDLPKRKIYCIDLRASERPAEFVSEIKRIAAEGATQVVGLTDWISGNAKPAQMERFLKPTNDTALGSTGGGDNGNGQAASPAEATPSEPTHEPIRIEEKAGRRWYPVIDFSRCTNCMECIDFCLFGVYGVDGAETILVEQPDNCRKGCPACSRVCPENAIIFPQHKTPTIAGADIVGETMKIDLSLLFGAPQSNKSAEEIAVAERDEQLQLAGREAVGASVGLQKRQAEQPTEAQDDLDNLVDELDALDL
jgi:NAD-dependent dihydropyrimidine dehydrogenase PreA subunit